MTQPEKTLVETAAVQQRSRELFAEYALGLPSPSNVLSLCRPMDLNTGRLGRYEIVPLEPSMCWPVTTSRNAFTMGVRPLSIAYPQPVAFHELRGPRGRMTTDSPNEVFTQWLAFRKARGHVLVSGLGLGMCIPLLIQIPAVRRVTVVEKARDVIKLVWPQVRELVPQDRVDVVQADIFRYLRRTNLPAFDFAYHDIWYGTGEATWADTVMPLFRATRRAGVAKMDGWCVQEMKGQLFTGLYNAARLAPNHTWEPYRVFLDAVRRTGEDPARCSDKTLVAALRLYLERVGTPKWERTFGRTM